MYLVLAVLALFTMGWLLYTRKKEGFKVLGALSPYKDLYYRCFSECERGDPTNRLYPTKGSFMCGEYCDSVITRMSREGGVSDPQGYKVPPPQINTAIDDSYGICGDGVRGDWCRALYTSNSEINESCKQSCQYSTRDQKSCVDLCSRALSANKSMPGGWSWK